MRKSLTMTALAVSVMVGCNARTAQHTSEHKRIAEACLAMMRSSLTNEAVVAMSDPRIPQVIRALQPMDIQLAGNDVVVICSGTPAEYHLSRRPNEPRVWILYAAGGKWGAEHKQLLRISE